MKTKLFFSFLTLLCLTGCYNYNELNTLAIAAGMSIDYEEEEYHVGILIANSKQAQVSTKEGEAQTIVYEGKGKTISEALGEIGTISPKKLYIGHLSFVVISEELAKKGVQDTLDYLLREPESIKRFYLIIAKDTKAKNVLKIVSPLESFPAQSISTAITFSKESQAVASTVPYSSFVGDLLKKGKEASLPTIEIKGDVKEGSSEDSLKETSPKAYLQLSNLAIFKSDKLIHITNQEEAKGSNLINNDSNEMLISCNCSGGKAEIELRNSSVKRKIEKKQGRPIAKVKLNVEASLQEITCHVNLEKRQTMLDLEEKASEEIKRLMEEAIQVAKKYKSDIFGFGNLFYKYYPKEFKEVASTWNEEGFPNLPVEIEVHVKLEYKGSIQNIIQED